jgi:hypothetical protein
MSYHWCHWSAHLRLRTGKDKSQSRGDNCLSRPYILSDYRSQGQTITNSIIGIGTPPTGVLTLFNMYVALSRSRGRDNIRLLRCFDEKLLMVHPCEYLRFEDERFKLVRLDDETEKTADCQRMLKI